MSSGPTARKEAKRISIVVAIRILAQPPAAATCRASGLVLRPLADFTLEQTWACSKTVTSETSENLRNFGEDLSNWTHRNLRRTSNTLLFSKHFLLRQASLCALARFLRRGLTRDLHQRSASAVYSFNKDNRERRHVLCQVPIRSCCAYSIAGRQGRPMLP
jgi:hypothetical protein